MSSSKVKLKQKKSGNNVTKIQLHLFIISQICIAFAVTLICIVKTFLQTALVSSHLNYCNSFLYGIIDTDLIKLQCIRNQLARLVTKSPPFTRSIPLLPSLHWLSVRCRILFKINLLTCETLREKQPVYLHSMLASSFPSHSLRSNRGISLSIPRTKTSTGSRALNFCGPSLRNSLLLSVHSVISVATFKKHLKTHLSGWPYPIDTIMLDGPLMKGTASLILLLNSDSVLTSLSLALTGILAV